MSATSEAPASEGPAAPTVGEREPLRVSLSVDDPVLAARAAALMAAAPGLRLVLPGEPADLVLSPAPPPPGVALTPRENEVLALMAEGASNKGIARALGISVHTAKFHVRSVVDKLDATGRTDAVAHAARQGVIHL